MRGGIPGEEMREHVLANYSVPRRGGAKGSNRMRDGLVGAPCKINDGLDGCEEEVGHREQDNR